MTTSELKTPWPWFGGKRRAASIIWERLGDVTNFIEPFAGSAAALLLRPHPGRIETVNDLDCYVANFWRGTQHDPEAVAAHADWPVNEADLHARHRWLVLSEPAKKFRQRMRTDPDYYDPKIAGWWCWGLCCWIGAGWCIGGASEVAGRPHLAGGDGGAAGRGVHASAGPDKLDLAQKVPGMIGGCDARGVNSQPDVKMEQKRPRAHRENGNNSGGELPGVLKHVLPQLADAYARGRGVHGNDAAEACAARRAWLIRWFSELRDRLRTVRVCCGDWKRVCDSHSVTTRLGVTGIFFDPPYSTEAGRDMDIYGVDSGTVAHDVRAYCLERGNDPLMRVCLAGYEGEGHEELEAHGWDVVRWKAAGGYGNRSERGKANSAKERLWFSPHCVQAERLLF